MKIMYVLIPSVLFLCTGIYLNAQKHLSPKIFTVKEVLDSASSLDKADTLVTLHGKFVERISNESFWFQDETGRIKVELEDSVLATFVHEPLQEISMLGEVDYDLLEGTEIEVEWIEAIRQ
jgi:uncharacterized protein (TIGR00156 family)